MQIKLIGFVSLLAVVAHGMENNIGIYSLFEKPISTFREQQHPRTAAIMDCKDLYATVLKGQTGDNLKCVDNVTNTTLLCTVLPNSAFHCVEQEGFESDNFKDSKIGFTDDERRFINSNIPS